MGEIENYMRETELKRDLGSGSNRELYERDRLKERLRGWEK